MRVSGTGARIGGLAVGAAAGMVAAEVASTGSMPTDARFVPAAIAAGIVAGLAAPGWAGYAAVLGGLLVGQHLTIGIVQFGTAVMAVLTSYGVVIGVAVRRMVWAPRPPWWRDGITWAWIGTAISVGIALAWMAIDMARNPF